MDKHVQGAGVSGEEPLVCPTDGIHKTMPRSIHCSASPLDFAQAAFQNASRKSMTFTSSEFAKADFTGECLAG